MSRSRKICLLLLTLTGSMAAQAASPASALAHLHRGDLVRVSLRDGPTYHLQFSGLDESSLVGRNGILSVHLLRREIASIEHEITSRESLPGLSAPSTAIWSLLSLTAVSFGAGPSCVSASC